ncbi:hypothetical protein D6774_01045 [Candidatus Woesearchaeota archaeon]|nr:MAG: hypothetical protein D6774_01045 [Candidatus Woesearchaeota archaeon]
MVNETFVNVTASVAPSADIGTATHLFITVIIPEIAKRFFAFLSTPFIYPETWWLLTHLLLTFILFEFYFDRHEDEDLGWGAALANSIVMVFVSMELLRAVYHHEGTPFSVLWNVVQDALTFSAHPDKVVILALILLLGILGIVTAVINYFHFLPRKVAFIISGHKTVNLLAYFLIVIVWRYTHGKPLPLDGITLVALFLFGMMMWGILLLVNFKRAKRKARQTDITLFK